MRMKLCIALAFAAFGAFGCAVQTDQPSEQAETNATEGLTFTSKTVDHVEGTYTHDQVSVHFVAEQNQVSSHFGLRDEHGLEVVDLFQDKTGLTLSVLGRASQKLDAATLAAMRNMTEHSEVSWSGITMEGDPRELENLEHDPSYAQLPALSRALGAQGITGRAYPATLQLHVFASRAAVALHTPPAATAPPPASPQAAPAEHLDGFSQPVPHATCTYPANQICCTTMNVTTGAFTGPVKCVAQAPACPWAYPDLRCDPNHDGCFGMCGPGCDDCWESVCGDCQYHWQCAQHDWVCREYSEYSDWNPLHWAYLSACYSVNAAISAVACAPDAIIAGY
jgi:hypothetical protein